MISVLIPTYNYNFSALVKELHKQLTSENCQFEIICIDDASNIKFEENNDILCLENYTVYILEKNIGRSAIRNLLAEKASFNWLLFLDSDTKPTSSNFIKNYLSVIRNNNFQEIFYGGVDYESTAPDVSKYLRWNSGIKRQKRSLLTRKEKPYETFFSSNFLVKKSTFNQIKFNENITTYGYEDLVFAAELKKRSIQINHIENAVFHLGLETNSDYIKKTKVAISNLMLLSEMKLLSENEIKLLLTYNKIKKYHFDIILSVFYWSLGNYLERYLVEGKSKLVMFDLFKISYMCYLSRN